MPSSRRLATKSSGEAQSAGLKRFQFFFFVRASGLGFMFFLFFGWGGGRPGVGSDFAFSVWGIRTSHYTMNLRGSVYVGARVVYRVLKRVSMFGCLPLGIACDKHPAACLST